MYIICIILSENYIKLLLVVPCWLAADQVLSKEVACSLRASARTKSARRASSQEVPAASPKPKPAKVLLSRPVRNTASSQKLRSSPATVSDEEIGSRYRSLRPRACLYHEGRWLWLALAASCCPGGVRPAAGGNAASATFR